MAPNARRADERRGLNLRIGAGLVLGLRRSVQVVAVDDLGRAADGPAEELAGLGHVGLRAWYRQSSNSRGRCGRGSARVVLVVGGRRASGRPERAAVGLAAGVAPGRHQAIVGVAVAGIQRWFRTPYMVLVSVFQPLAFAVSTLANTL
jgi:hypothetical protein